MGFAFIRRKIKQFAEHICSFVQKVVSDKTKVAEATCIKGATYKYSCSCGNVSSNSTDTFEYGAVNSSNHTNIVNGGTASVHKKCEGCGKTTSSTHSFSYSKLSSANSNYYKYHKASCNCGYSSTTYSHKWNDNAGTSSTCSTTGCKLICTHNLDNDDYTDTTHYCSVCKRNIAHKMRHYQVTDGSWRYGCYYCKFAKAHNVSFERTVSAPSCTTPGEDQYMCAECFSSVYVTTPATGHQMDYFSRTEPTCTENGEFVTKCEFCDYTETEVLEKTGHTTMSAWTPLGCGFCKVKRCSTCNEITVSAYDPNCTTHNIK